MKSTAATVKSTLNLVMPGLDGAGEDGALMAQLRREPLQEIAGTKVVRMRDYQDGSRVRHGPR